MWENLYTGIGKNPNFNVARFRGRVNFSGPLGARLSSAAFASSSNTFLACIVGKNSHFPSRLEKLPGPFSRLAMILLDYLFGSPVTWIHRPTARGVNQAMVAPIRGISVVFPHQSGNGLSVDGVAFVCQCAELNTGDA